MKRLSTIVMCLFAMMAASLSVKAQEVTITLFPGCTWISYPGTEVMDVATALGDFVPAEGDIIKSQYSSSIYRNGYWMGGVTHFIPGMGYKYYSNRTEVVSFVFGEAAPQLTVTTAEPTEITINSATWGGNVTSTDGDYVSVTLKGVCWSTNPNPTFNDNYIEAGNGLGSFTVSMNELISGMVYYVRAFAVTATGTFYGNEVSFSTYDFVDLGLPSGTLWATFNVGANAPEEYGDYFAWGEINSKEVYDWSTYQFCNGSESTMTKYCTDSDYGYNGFIDNLTTLLPEDDAATANWGSDWRMPTLTELEELFQNTTSTWTTQNGVNGRLFTASNGNSIFLPATGYYSESGLNAVGDFGGCWCSSLSPIPSHAYFFSFWSESFHWGSNSRFRGRSVRAVRSGSQNNTPTGAIGGKFTINSNGDQVYFSQGNLQYQASTNTWRFAENQWDFVGSQNPAYGEPGGTVNGSDNHNISSTYNGWIDLFGWGTSGWDNGNTYYQPWSTAFDEESYYGQLYGPPGTFSLTGNYANADWGVFNSISNGGNQPNQWRTLTYAEWNYVFNSRITASGVHYAKANVNNVNGVILLPDDWRSSYYTLSNPNSSGVSYSINTITASQWIILEQHGAVFLPAAGHRAGTFVDNVGSYGYYWSASFSNNVSASLVYFYNTFLCAENLRRYYGQSVRLVAPAEN